MKLMKIREFEKYLMEEKGFEAYEEFEDALQEAICLQEEDDETFFKILEDNGIQIYEDETTMKLENYLQLWLWEAEDAGWFD